ncbi:hypothetical protein BDD12DRAFT_807996 [Trichophaea hybrida]|nr:hypothetical protein BDD12DRAFT_807996 [Trichophaea hybrida]
MSSSPPSSPLSEPPLSPGIPAAQHQPSTSDSDDDAYAAAPGKLQPLPRACLSECAWLIDFVNRHYGPDEAKDWKMVTEEFNRHFRTNKSQRGVLVTYSNLLRKGKPRKKREREGEEYEDPDETRDREHEEVKYERELRSTRQKKRKSEGGEEGEGEGQGGMEEEIDVVATTATAITTAITIATTTA